MSSGEHVTPVAATDTQPLPEKQPDLPPWVKRLLWILGCAGPFLGALAGSIATSNDVDVIGLIREALGEIKGPLGGYVLAFLMLVALSWHHLRTISKYESIIEARGKGHRETVREKDSQLLQAADKTISVFKGTVERYEKVLKEVNARTDQTNAQILELRSEVRALRAQLERPKDP